MKKTIRLMLVMMLAAALLVSVCGCAPGTSEEPTATVAPSEDVNETPSPEPTTEPEPTPSPTPEILPLVPPEVSLETKELEPVIQPEVGANGKVLLNSVIVVQSTRTIEYWVDDPYKPMNAFGSPQGDFVKLDQGLPVTMRFFADVKIRLTDYSFVTKLISDDKGDNRPATWKLYGANLSNFEDEVLLDARENVELPTEDGAESELFAIASPDYYEFYKIIFEKSAGNTQTVEFDDLNLYGEDGNCIGDYIKYNSSLDGYTIMNGALNLKMSNAEPLPQDYNPSHLYDCDLDTYALVNCQYAKEYNEVGVDFIFAFRQAVKIDAYRFTTYEIGCPVSWTLYASNDKKLSDDVCTAIDVRTDEAMPAYEYGESDVFEVQNTGYYKYYKIRIYKDIFGGNDENWLNPAWRELTLLMKNENVGKTN